MDRRRFIIAAVVAALASSGRTVAATGPAAEGSGSRFTTGKTTTDGQPTVDRSEPRRGRIGGVETLRPMPPGRCRATLERAQLGDYDPADLERLRNGCG